MDYSHIVLKDIPIIMILELGLQVDLNIDTSITEGSSNFHHTLTLRVPFAEGPKLLPISTASRSGIRRLNRDAVLVRRVLEHCGVNVRVTVSNTRTARGSVPFEVSELYSDEYAPGVLLTKK